MTATSTVDDLCRSYLDLKYHFDPSAASSAGLVSEDGRLGRFDLESTREHISALRSISGAIEELDTDDRESEIDRTGLLGEIRSTIYRLEHEQPQPGAEEHPEPKRGDGARPTPDGARGRGRHRPAAS